jgi:hypothetical protein
MIVQYTEEGWQLITQRAHGLLAFQIASKWKHEKTPKRWAEFLLAVAEHDDAEVELDGEELLTKQGGPLNFEMKTFDLANCQRLSHFSLTKSRYIALLTSMHMTFLYHKETKSNPEAKKFLALQLSLQKKLLNELKLTKSEADSAYRLLEWCDALSLLLCQSAIQPEGRLVEISAGPDEKKYQLHALDNDRLTIDPWPFDESPFTVSAEFRVINQLQFKDSAELRQKFLEAEVKELYFTFKK